MEDRRKRKCLSDITDTFNLTPTSALCKMVADSTNPKSLSKPPFSILKSSSVSSNLKLCSESSNRSDTSIGSSNTGAWSSRTVQFRTPPYAVSSITRPGGNQSKDGSYNRQQMTEKNTKENEDNVLVVSPTSVEKSKRKMKAIAVPFSPSPLEKLKENTSDASNPGSFFEREKQKGPAYRNLFSGLVEIVEESNRGTLNSYSRSYEKTDKGKASLNSSDCASAKPSRSSDGGSKRILKQSGSSSGEKRETGKEFVYPSDILERTKEKEKSPDLADSIRKIRGKGKEIMNSSCIIDLTKSKGSSASVTVKPRPPRRKSEKRKSDGGAYSCPPIKRIDLDEDEDKKFWKSWTDAQPKLKKTRSRTEATRVIEELPREFVEQQIAYFKELDDFQLMEEEVSEGDIE